MILEKKIKWRLILSSILGLILVSSPLYAENTTYYKSFGNINYVKTKTISIGDGYYPLSATVKVLDLKGNSISTYKLKEGDYVQLTIQRTGNKRIVDTIKRLPDPEKEGK